MAKKEVELGPKLKRYWEFEEPKILRTKSNEFRLFKECKKLQIFRIVEKAPRGIGKGVTIDLTELKDPEKLLWALGFEE